MVKKSYRDIPDNIKRQIKMCADKPFVIFSVLRLRPGDKLPNLPGINEALAASQEVPEKVLPDPTKGTWARRNALGWEIIRTDLSKVTKTFSHESPNWGDWYNGSHEVIFEREVYQRDVFPGQGLTITAKVLKTSDDEITMSFELDRVFSRVPDDPRELLFALNIFQESVGHSAVKPTDLPADSFIGSLKIDWEILPIGERDKILEHINARLAPSPSESKIIEDRLDLLLSMKPRNLVTGTSNFARYVGAQFSDEFVVFDNIRYGNAIYAMFEDWERLSRMTRVDLLKSNENFERIVHRQGWKAKLKTFVKEHLARENRRI